jgi:hypothetical protein
MSALCQVYVRFQLAFRILPPVYRIDNRGLIAAAAVEADRDPFADTAVV